MFTSELTKMIKNKKFIILFIVLFLITFPDLISNWVACLYPPHFISWRWVTHPCKAAFLSGTSRGHIPQIILNWLLPIILLLMGCDSANQDRKLGIRNTYVVLKGRKQYYNAKIGVSFFVPFAAMFIIALLNWLLCILIFRNGISFSDLETQITKDMAPYLYYQFHHPYLIYFAYTLLFSIVTGFCGVLCQCLAILFKDIKKVYFISFIIWIIQISCPPYITNALQPFTETTLTQTVLGILRFLVIVVFIWFGTLIIKSRKKDEI